MSVDMDGGPHDSADERSGWAPDQPDDTLYSPATESVAALVRRLVAEGQFYATAEARRQKLRFAYYGRLLVGIAIMALIAVVLLLGSLVALLVGLIVAIAPLTGAFWATLIVIGGALLTVLLLAWFIRTRLRTLMSTIASGKPLT